MYNRNFNHMGHGPGFGPGMHRGHGFGHGQHRGPGFGPGVYRGFGRIHRAPRPMRPMFFGPVFRPRHYYGYGPSSFGCLGPFLFLILLASVLVIR